MFPFLGRTNFNAAGEFFRLWTKHRDDQHAVLEQGILHLNAVSQQEAPLKLPRRDAAMQEFPGRIVLLAATDHELVVFAQDIELVEGKARNRDRDQEALAAVVLDGSFDVVGRIAVGSLGDAVEQTLDLVEAEQERTG